LSNYLTIAVVTAAIHQMVQSAVQEVAPGVTVRVGPPRGITPGEKEVNLYLYHLTPNAQLRNQALPARNGDGALVARPMVAVDLHYLICFGSEDHLATELMLAKVLIDFCAKPVLTEEDVGSIARAGGTFPFLATSDLVGQLEHIKLTPEFLTLEELSKLWTVFFQLAHRPSLQYVASPILLDSGGIPVEAPEAIEVNVKVDSEVVE
jgi:hypothetical protein